MVQYQPDWCNSYLAMKRCAKGGVVRGCCWKMFGGCLEDVGGMLGGKGCCWGRMMFGG